MPLCARSILLLVALLLCPHAAQAEEGPPLRLSWENRMLTIRGEAIPGGELPVWYIEAYCRPGSTDRDWHETVIPHKSTLGKQTTNGERIVLRDQLEDGVVVEHVITAHADNVTFEIIATNPTETASQVHWAQPCVRVDRFTGTSPEDRMQVVPPYVKQCFIWVDGKPTQLPAQPWATEARYTPGQVYAPEDVPRDDVNPRPLSEVVPSNGLIACQSADGKMVLGVAFEPCQELFQGVITCIHSDLRIGGLKPGETKKIRGKIYVLSANLKELEQRYRADFP